MDDLVLLVKVLLPSLILVATICIIVYIRRR
jgi:hypothetical protein